MRKTLPFLAALAAACLMTPAQAQTSGGYAGVGVMSVATDNASEFAAVNATSGERTANGLKVYGGYLWNRFGVEVGYYDLGSYDVFTGGTKTDEFAIAATAVSGVFAMPFASQFVFNAKLGLAFTAADYTCISLCSSSVFSSSKSSVAGLFGAGVGWRPAQNFTLRADLETFADILHRAGVFEARYPYSAFSVSGQFNF
jgi:hypothetical protein